MWFHLYFVFILVSFYNFNKINEQAMSPECLQYDHQSKVEPIDAVLFLRCKLLFSLKTMAEMAEAFPQEVSRLSDIDFAFVIAYAAYIVIMALFLYSCSKLLIVGIGLSLIGSLATGILVFSIQEKQSTSLQQRIVQEKTDLREISTQIYESDFTGRTPREDASRFFVLALKQMEKKGHLSAKCSRAKSSTIKFLEAAYEIEVVYNEARKYQMECIQEEYSRFDRLDEASKVYLEKSVEMFSRLGR